MAISLRGRDYEPDRIWSRTRILHSVDVSRFSTRASLEDYLRGVFRRDKYLANLGPEGRGQLIDRAFQEWGMLPPETHMVTLLAMRERGLLSASEYYRLAETQGLTAGQAEHQYRKWTGTEQAVFDMKYKDILRHGEYSKLLRAKHLSRGAGYYRYRKFLATSYGVPFRGWEKPASRPRSRHKTLG